MGRVGFEHKTGDEHFLLGNSTWLPITSSLDAQDDNAIDAGPGPYLVTWITSPVLEHYHVNYNLYQDSALGKYVKKCFEEETVIFGALEAAPAGNITSSNEATAFFATLNSFNEEQVVPYLGDPMARLFLPIYDSFGEERKAVAVSMAIINWKHYFTNVLPGTMQGITVVLENECDGSFTYAVHGRDTQVVGLGSLHNPEFAVWDHMGSFEKSYVIKDGSKLGLAFRAGECPYSLHVYPSQVC
jgi:hypothetical protein